jgi:serine/threonine protein kinase
MPDLKPQNIGFDADKTLKLFDFGLAACVQKKRTASDTYDMTGYTGTLVYMAPEVVLRKRYNEKVDVFSLPSSSGRCSAARTLMET